MVESMVDAAISMGFPASLGLELVTEMLSGTMTLLKESKKHPAELKWQVTAPGGTTIAGIKALEHAGLRAAIIETFLATYQKTLTFHS